MEQRRYLTKEKQVGIAVLDMPLLNARQGRGLTGVLISDIVLQLLSCVAQTERENIWPRQADGGAAAQTREVTSSEAQKKRRRNTRLSGRRRLVGEKGARECGKLLRASHSIFLTRVKNNQVRKASDNLEFVKKHIFSAMHSCIQISSTLH